MDMIMSVSADSGMETVTDTSSNVASSSSTPPTTVADSASLHSESSKQDVINVAEDAADADALVTPAATPAATTPAVTPGGEPRIRRARSSVPVYNLSQLSGTAAHGKRRAKGDIVSDRRRRTISGDTLVDDAAPGAAVSRDNLTKAMRDGIDALDLQWSPGRLNTPRTRRQIRESPRAVRNSRLGVAGTTAAAISTKFSTISKRSRKAVDKGVTKMSRELRRLQDTKEFAHIDEAPVVHTVWSNGKYIDPSEPVAPPARKKAKLEPAEEKEPEKEEKEPVTNTRKRRVKKFLSKGLYSGQDAPKDPTKGLTTAEKKKLAQLPELAPSSRVNKTMPAPMFTGLRMLIAGRDFKLPYHVCNPLPPGQPKPDEWKKMTKNRFIGDSKDYWRKTPHYMDQSKCVCLPDDGCGESCQNRIMLYECDEGNCNIGKVNCTNRAFADLTARRAKGGKYRVGVEVIKTSDRGYGVRSNRCFEPNQIIMEYAGEIITEEECERRMNEIYKNNDCYYLMSFDQNMIIDATTGSIARFVNHSCDPNCRMIKWIVSGQPRMALFAGDRPIRTGDELTYDYNFDPFSAKNVQKCLCGSHNCRGILGPKPKEVRPPKDLKATVKATVKAGKRKLKEMVGDDEPASGSKAKKRKVIPVKGVKRSLSNASLKAAKGAATALKKSVSTITVNSKKVSATAKSPVQRRASTGALLKKTLTTTKKVIKTYGKSGTPRKGQQVSSRSSSMTIVAKGDDAASVKSGKKTPKKTPTKKTPVKLANTKASPRSVNSRKSVAKSIAKSIGKSPTPRKALELSRNANIRVVTADE